jgi:CRISPR-associated Csx2 family protein
MSRTFISFLGTNNYLPCNYYDPKAPEERVEIVRFVQEATIRLHCKEWNQDDQICIFTTSEAKTANWKDDGHKDMRTNEYGRSEGLECKLSSFQSAAALRCIDIPAGNSSKEIWEIFNKVYDVLRGGDELVFDITHAFRSIPLIALVILNYAKVMKGIRLTGIFYGAFEILGSFKDAGQIPPEKRNVPLLDLTPLNQLMEWTFAVDCFLESGDAKRAHKMATAIAAESLKHSKGENREAAVLKSIAESLMAFSRAMTTCRGMEISDAAEKLRRSLSYEGPFELAPPLHPLFIKIRDNMEPFGNSVVADGIQAARWCLEHNLIQQGYTILEEVVLTGLLEMVEGGDPYSMEQREVAAQALNILIKRIEDDETKWKKEARESKTVTLKLHDILKTAEYNPLVKTADSISQLRNDLNHAGHNHNALRLKKADDFPKRLDNLIHNVAECFLLST